METFLKIVGFIFAAIAAGISLYDVGIGRKSQLRDEYRFAKEFLDDIGTDKSLHPLQKEKGYQAIAGDESVSADEIEYILSLEEPSRRLRLYVMGRPLVKFSSYAGDMRIVFQEKYQAVWARRWRKWLYLGLYLVLFLLAVAPIWGSRFLFAKPSQVLIALLFTMPLFFPSGWFFLKKATRITCAENLVSMQKQHTKRIIVRETSRIEGSKTPVVETGS